jgi:hypothetical protein
MRKRVLDHQRLWEEISTLLKETDYFLKAIYFLKSIENALIKPIDLI